MKYRQPISNNILQHNIKRRIYSLIETGKKSMLSEEQSWYGDVDGDLPGRVRRPPTDINNEDEINKVKGKVKVKRSAKPAPDVEQANQQLFTGAAYKESVEGRGGTTLYVIKLGGIPLSGPITLMEAESILKKTNISIESEEPGWYVFLNDKYQIAGPFKSAKLATDVAENKRREFKSTTWYVFNTDTDRFDAGPYVKKQDAVKSLESMRDSIGMEWYIVDNRTGQNVAGPYRGPKGEKIAKDNIRELTKKIRDFTEAKDMYSVYNAGDPRQAGKIYVLKEKEVEGAPKVNVKEITTPELGYYIVANGIILSDKLDSMEDVETYKKYLEERDVEAVLYTSPQQFNKTDNDEYIKYIKSHKDTLSDEDTVRSWLKNNQKIQSSNRINTIIDKVFGSLTPGITPETPQKPSAEYEEEKRRGRPTLKWHDKEDLSKEVPYPAGIPIKVDKSSLVNASTYVESLPSVSTLLGKFNNIEPSHSIEEGLQSLGDIYALYRGILEQEPAFGSDVFKSEKLRSSLGNILDNVIEEAKYKLVIVEKSRTYNIRKKAEEWLKTQTTDSQMIQRILDTVYIRTGPRVSGKIGIGADIVGRVKSGILGLIRAAQDAFSAYVSIKLSKTTVDYKKLKEYDPLNFRDMYESHYTKLEEEGLYIDLIDSNILLNHGEIEAILGGRRSKEEKEHIKRWAWQIGYNMYKIIIDKIALMSKENRIKLVNNILEVSPNSSPEKLREIVGLPDINVLKKASEKSNLKEVDRSILTNKLIFNWQSPNYKEYLSIIRFFIVPKFEGTFLKGNFYTAVAKVTNNYKREKKLTEADVKNLIYKDKLNDYLEGENLIGYTKIDQETLDPTRVRTFGTGKKSTKLGPPPRSSY